MRIKHLLGLFFICLYAWACSTEKTAATINGVWDVQIYEIVDCRDRTQSVFADLSSDSCFSLGLKEVCVNSFTYDFDSLGRSQQYVIERQQTTDGIVSNFREEGNYNIEGLNRLILCNPECDSMFVVRNDRELEIVNIDTLTGCGTVIRAVKANQ